MGANKIRKDYKENKEEWNKILDEGTRVKYEKCTTDGKFDYLKMSQMYHNGEW